MTPQSKAECTAYKSPKDFFRPLWQKESFPKDEAYNVSSMLFPRLRNKRNGLAIHTQ